MKSCIHLIVHGLVQGVFFRASTVEKAQELNITGWIKNGSDGESVEIVAEGSKKDLEELIVWVKKGPPGAKVDRIDITWGKYEGNFLGFTVKR